VGLLKSFEAGTVTVVDEKNNEVAIPRQKISKARLEVEF
jgi:ribosome maturation factor RimP